MYSTGSSMYVVEARGKEDDMGKVMRKDQPVIEEELQSRDKTQSTEPLERLSLLQPRHVRERYFKVTAIVKSIFPQKYCQGN